MRKNNDIAYMLPKVIYPDGSLQYLCKLLPTPFDLIFRRFFPDIGVTRKLNDTYSLKMSGYDRIINPPCLSGCFMFLRMSIIKENNLFFDERFFMYCEDFDFIRRLHRIAKTIYQKRRKAPAFRHGDIRRKKSARIFY
jgi:GT2 family glycosyltransferase